VWQFVSERDEVSNFADRGWRNAMDRPGANQVKFLKYVIESRNVNGRRRDLSLVVEGQGNSKKDHVEAFYGASNRYAMVYLPLGRSLVINASQLAGKRVRSYWYNPRDGAVTLLPGLAKSAAMTFVPPTSGVSNDWVLVIEDADAGFPALVSFRN
jgi:hypothetical protein